MRLGSHVSEESKAKISAAKKGCPGRSPSPETRTKISAARTKLTKAQKKEHHKEYQRAYYCRHREEFLEKAKSYSMTHAEEKKKRQAERYAANPERYKAYAAAYNASHSEDIKEWHAEWVTAHREQVLAYASAYRAKFPDRERLHKSKRRALKYGNTPIEELLTEAQWHEVLTKYHYRCAYCGCKLGYSKEQEHVTLDHVIPLALGGKHSKDNVVPACSHCNSVKQARTPEQWVGVAIA